MYEYFLCFFYMHKRDSFRSLCWIFVFFLNKTSNVIECLNLLKFRNFTQNMTTIGTVVSGFLTLSTKERNDSETETKESEKKSQKNGDDTAR